ncbi:tail assembly chaperone [Liquorilactobacillus nagelii]|uniref:tail assembly chaperone n=1 Tax=Liquorilactobacillus nagelii TaxID=82688 RepID=UPI0006F13EAD|nr:tail assembly chaperone [Liquorilactobacillus nagelii]KRL40734.1 hypothetical protein FD45_GL001378 [Liquorilactobacillus nagelii DSM 13675]QYH53696.1 hypothetical protein G6O73_02870 [Liquorilactobacillus nagelii DSM 13675]
MDINLKGQRYKLHFGIGFIKELDEIFKSEVMDIEFGTGVNTIYVKLQTPNPYPLYQALHAALNTQIDLKEEEFDEWVDSLPTMKAFTDFFDKFVKELENQRQTKPLISNYKKTLAEMAKKVQEEAKGHLSKPTEK